MAAKKTTAKKAPATQTGTKKTGIGQTGTGKTGTGKAETKQASARKVPAKQAAAKTEPKKTGAVTAAEVHMGHIFALRPRVATAFRPEDLRAARHLLAEESYENAEVAARAVADKALELLNDGPARTKKGPSRRW